ncbi:MAG: hypothetical protein OXH05_04110 [Acidobacteria bacterium]|nr:hypothetical protein [Acidobacteriota bacterium]
MLDIAKIRHFYFHPPPDDPERLPSREELYAREERRAVELCLQCGDDPREDSLGEHGALIGGAGKPPRDFTWDPEIRNRIPLPLAWFEHPRATATPPTPPDRVSAFFAHLSGGHLAGYPNRPTGDELARIFRSPHMTAVERDQVWHVLACIHPWDLPGLLWSGGMSVYQIARAIHLSESRQGHVIAWINLFGVPP